MLNTVIAVVVTVFVVNLIAFSIKGLVSTIRNL